MHKYTHVRGSGGILPQEKFGSLRLRLVGFGQNIQHKWHGQYTDAQL